MYTSKVSRNERNIFLAILTAKLMLV